MNLKKVVIFGVATLSAFAMTACSNKTATNSNGKKNKGTVALITDGNGVNATHLMNLHGMVSLLMVKNIT